MADEIKVKLVADVEVNKQKIAADIQQGIQQGASAAGGKGIRLSQISNLPEHIRKQLLASGQVEAEPIDQRAMERSRAAIERSIVRVREAQAKHFKQNPPPIIPVPPVIPVSKSILDHLKTMGDKGGLMGGFGRYEIGRAAMDALGMGGGVGGRLGGAALAGFGGKIPGLTAAVVAATLALEGLKIAAKQMIEGAKEGSKLYEQSRAIGRSTVQTSSYLKTLGAVGIEESMAMRLAAYGQFGRGRGAGGGGLRGSVAGEMIAAGRSAGMSVQELQQIANMSKEIDEAWRQTRLAAIATANVAYQNFRSIMAWKIFENDFRAFWQQMSGIFGGVAETVLKIGHGLMQVVNTFVYLEARMLQGLRTMAEFMGRIIVPFNPAVGAALLGAANLLPRSDPGDPSRIGGFTRDTHFSSLERMGLVIGGHQDKSTKYLERIAQNTGRMADRLQAVLGGGREHGSIGRQQPPNQVEQIHLAPMGAVNLP